MLRMEESLQDLRKNERKDPGDEGENSPGEHTDGVDFGAEEAEEERQSPGHEERPRPV